MGGVLAWAKVNFDLIVLFVSFLFFSKHKFHLSITHYSTTVFTCFTEPSACWSCLMYIPFFVGVLARMPSMEKYSVLMIESMILAD